MNGPTENTGLEAEDNTSSPLEDDQEVEIELVDDVPEKDRGRKPLEKSVEEPTEEELGAYSEGVRKRINDLTHARHDERRAKEQTLREKQELDRIARALADENRQLREQLLPDVLRVRRRETLFRTVPRHRARHPHDL